MSRVLFTSIPKCGTHLLLRYLDGVGFRCGGPHDATAFDAALLRYVRDLQDGCYSAFHYPHRPQIEQIARDRDLRVVFLYRDPRAQVVSRLNFMQQFADHPFARFLRSRWPSAEDRLIRLIEGFSDVDLAAYQGAAKLRINFDPQMGGLIAQNETCGRGPASSGVGGLNDLYRSFGGWLDAPDVFRVRYEDVVGPEGRGSAKTQRKTVAALTDFVGAPDTTRSVEQIAASLYDRQADTFHIGRIDAWRESFTPRVAEAFDSECGQLLSLWGYSAGGEAT